MADTARTLAALQALLADNTSGDISPQDVRDMLVSLFPQTTKGDLPGIDAAGILGRLPATTDGFVLVLDSAETYGFKWVATHTEAHTLASHSSKPHSELTGVATADHALHPLVDGSRPLTGDWDNIGRRIRNTGIAEVAAAAPSTPATGLVWLDTLTDATGTASLAITTKTASYTATDSDAVILCNASAAAIRITLPTAVGRLGRVYNIKKIDSSSNIVTVDGDGGETIDDGTTAVLTVQYEAITIISDGAEWWIL